MTFIQAFRYEVTADQSSPFSELAALVDCAREAGASADTPVRAVPSMQDTDIVDHLLVELDSTAVPAPKKVAVSLAVVQELRTLLGDMRESDGDIRDFKAGLQACHEALVELADGEDIGNEITW
ncbi:hypothetical protein ATK36_3338 [Amycolatopsis sulphurea]|uniref:Uncharacterized protein n=1 Tax=Amycolatopsis sulphurea TaxID=76022 RepID=A0A2A9FCV0_9PSEU|nr:hypothetical protein [Amycolatopsis sulphurea]PFG48259.1 hypothetical protein ATK36_3338 [Amycolatopsis sulphurea]